MQKPLYLYHGSGRELIGDKLLPKKAIDLDENPDNSLEGIYASDIKDEALAMGVLSCKGVGPASLGTDQEGNVVARMYKGEPEQEYFYLYTLSSQTFRETPQGSHQWVSLEPVKPEKIEKLPVKEYLHLVRKATEEEKEEFFKKHKDKLELFSSP